MVLERSKADEFRDQMQVLLIDALGHSEPAVRAWAANAVGGLEQPLKDVVPKLRELLQDESDQVREAARKAIKQLDSLAGEGENDKYQ